MNALKRHEKIMEILIERKEVAVGELSSLLDVTGKTIREDLARLEEKGLLMRVHGGAMLAQNDQFGILSAQGTGEKHAAEKAEIASRALRYIEPNDIIALDGGGTTLEIARRLPNEPLTVVTNDLFILSELARKDKIRLVVPGGERVRNVLIGPRSAEFVEGLNISKAFLSATALDSELGASIYTGDLVPYKKALVKTARKVYGVAEHQKFGQFALWTFAACEEMDVIITDSGIDPAQKDLFAKKNIRLDDGGEA
ncbi:DeoR/GlpR family DNA-binding transcription regulator [Saccharibacillus sp. CPCC 101409]|uniref:DeoR/GlpR family DNA-binding transcription regulator n=1 Tax=Saccharibacillus sp. CPCC 101409 TaxID=3058041 RepID=UPI002670D67B|nr:DeoR/GlpR family DNA-binding transcription regulator [Saccharibacillus sp. CPCC 101409]MDO3412762.1 DeoR/GlpR family DNA-binding transcription regulator [Saccharibacillus sp. CPCC 101409]